MSSLTLGNRMSVKICKSIASNVQAAQADTRAPQAPEDSPLRAGNRLMLPVWPNTLMAFSEQPVQSHSTLSRALIEELGLERTGIWTKAPRSDKLRRGETCRTKGGKPK